MCNKQYDYSHLKSYPVINGWELTFSIKTLNLFSIVGLQNEHPKLHEQIVLHVKNLAPMLKIFFPSYMKQILGMQKEKSKDFRLKACY